MIFFDDLNLQYTLPGTNISHLGKFGTSSPKVPNGVGDVSFRGRVPFLLGKVVTD